MDENLKPPTGVHFHIRWNRRGYDWEGHATRADALESAEKLAGLQESFTIEEVPNETCAICGATRAAAQRA